MSTLPLAFLMGLLSSLHCAVMCGPLMLGLQAPNKNYLKSAVQLLLYQSGRILVYTLLGSLVGAIGSGITLFTSQETLSFMVGMMLMGFTLMHFSGRFLPYFDGFQKKLIYPISKLMGRIHGKPLWGFFAGMLNGLIPCGMVYLAMATALHSNSINGAASFMFLFGLGTAPLMMLISLGGIYLGKYIHFRPNKLVPWLVFFLGAMFILRAAGLGIPFLSPDHHLGAKGHVSECRPQ
ncbi:sulfite exporter TauE/SafE family protein [Pedobacter sp.]|uniref:sulfite exporter TauE/SafE family protein n=1 Tax=Pedobacter sp. TaxID=1411316 RepID=UPI0031D40FC7